LKRAIGEISTRGGEARKTAAGGMSGAKKIKELRGSEAAHLTTIPPSHCPLCGHMLRVAKISLNLLFFGILRRKQVVALPEDHLLDQLWQLKFALSLKKRLKVNYGFL
jgi:hypothetical protein